MFGGGRSLANRYPERLESSSGDDVYGLVVGTNSRNTYLVQCYFKTAHEAYSYTETEKKQQLDGRPSFAEEVRIGFPRLSINDRWVGARVRRGRKNYT